MTHITNIAVLISCHNRINKTLQCLLSLYSQSFIKVSYNIDVFLVDDASTDGTGEAVKNQFPEVNIIQGNGNLYWNRGMYLAWETAAAKKDFDYYLLLNDDTFLFNNAILTLLQSTHTNSIITGTTKSQINNNPTYGGYNSINNHLISPNGVYQRCDYSNGNCVLVPKIVFKKLGNLDPIFHHALGDFDYFLRARKIGIEIFVAPHFIGLCEQHLEMPNWLNSKYNLFVRLKYLYQPKSGCNPFEFFLYDRRHKNIFVAIFHFFTIHFKCILTFKKL